MTEIIGGNGSFCSPANKLHQTLVFAIFYSYLCIVFMTGAPAILHGSILQFRVQWLGSAGGGPFFKQNVLYKTLHDKA